MKKIVIVEADPDARFLFSHTLCKEFIVEFVQNGKELLVHLPDTDMIVINTLLADSTLHKLCEKLRPGLKADVPILAIAASADTEALQHNCPADGILSRPFTDGQLKEAINSLIKK